MARHFHRTTEQRAAEVLARGFVDGTAEYGFRDERGDPANPTGVWISDFPVDANEGTKGEVLLLVGIAPELIEPFDWSEEGSPYRQFCVPAAVLNASATIRLATVEEEEQALLALPSDSDESVDE